MINFDIFIEAYQNLFKEKLRVKQIDGLHFLISKINKDLGTELIDNIEQAAYILATVKHETANTYQPIKEYGRGLGRTYGKPDPITGKTYYGRGYVQLTWKRNYAAMSELVTRYLLNKKEISGFIDLVTFPDTALEPEIAYLILVLGLDKGVYGKDLDDCISNRLVDFILARRTVNGKDKANLIAGYAHNFLECLRDSQ